MIIAEAGINHNGSYKLAVKLAQVAKNSGADTIKYQTFWNISKLKRYEFSKDEWIRLKGECEDIGIKFMSTPHTFEAIHFLDDLQDIYKIASPYLCNINFLREVETKDKPILLSTGNLIHENGLATIEEVRRALSFLNILKVTLIHCVSKYPCLDPHYDRIYTLKRFGYPVGLSDHSKTIKVPKGLPVYEKHIMLDGEVCPDKDVSLTPNEFKEMVKWLRFT